MREFSWRYFTLTGDIDAYLLYKRHEALMEDDEQQETEIKDVDVDET
ncbi:YqzL family protein [Alicyclobacillus mengziensis]|uniref:YqzL family protein n=1 Tax=Alicyclobacillus mengziensis TaxID=2931921 RepID=A0A9X7VWD5_9BACL|nr:YqzL family protein [Alicyclobacillus mengziensis]QSO46102.1 YqzL family protein [Alicyclobacillus mengziensis]